MKQKLPHFTRNTALAVTAFLLRIPVTRKRVYTEEWLRSSGKTGKRAYAEKILGDVYYAIHVENDPDFALAVSAFNDEKLAIEEGRDTGPLTIPVDEAARMCCRLLFARKNFIRDLFNLIPFVRIKHDGRVARNLTADGGHTLTVPGFKDIRIDADENTKNHLK